MRLKPKNVVQLAFAYAKVDDQYVPEAAKEGHADEDVAVAFKLVCSDTFTLSAFLDVKWKRPQKSNCAFEYLLCSSVEMGGTNTNLGHLLAVPATYSCFLNMML